MIRRVMVVLLGPAMCAAAWWLVLRRIPRAAEWDGAWFFAAWCVGVIAFAVCVLATQIEREAAQSRRRRTTDCPPVIGMDARIPRVKGGGGVA